MANVKESTYRDVMTGHGSAFADRGSWESLKDDDDLSIHVLAWHLADTLDSLKVAPTHLRGVTPDEAAAVEHQTGLWTRPAPPKDPLSQKQIGDAMKHLDVMAPRFERADWIICGSGVWTC